MESLPSRLSSYSPSLILNLQVIRPVQPSTSLFTKPKPYLELEQQEIRHVLRVTTAQTQVPLAFERRLFRNGFQSCCLNPAHRDSDRFPWGTYSTPTTMTRQQDPTLTTTSTNTSRPFFLSQCPWQHLANTSRWGYFYFYYDGHDRDNGTLSTNADRFFGI